MAIEVLNESGFAVPGLAEFELVEVARSVLTALHVHPKAEMSILLVDSGVMAELHEKWLGEPGSTDVLSFPMDEVRPGSDGELAPPGTLGDVVICPEVAAKQAQGHAVADEMLLLTVHGVLHLLGYDHAEPAEEVTMFALQRRLLLAYLARR